MAAEIREIESNEENRQLMNLLEFMKCGQT
jgi:hypothetical protein